MGYISLEAYFDADFMMQIRTPNLFSNMHHVIGMSEHFSRYFFAPLQTPLAHTQKLSDPKIFDIFFSLRILFDPLLQTPWPTLSLLSVSHLDANANKETKTRQTTVSSFKQEKEQCCQILAASNSNLVSVFVPLTRNPKRGGGALF